MEPGNNLSSKNSSTPDEAVPWTTRTGGPIGLRGGGIWGTQKGGRKDP